MKTKKGEKGPSAQYITRSVALRKLQLSLADFRRLCILKGIYPREPKRALKGKDKTYYHCKDITYLSHERLIRTFRELKVYKRKFRRAICRKEKAAARALAERKPVYSLFHLVKERYPTVLDCMRDLDDALSTLALFATLPVDDKRGITANVIAEAMRLTDEFLLFMVAKRLLRKVFCSVKGFYLQAVYLGQPITFLLPHEFPQDLPPEVDFKVMLTFLELYTAVVKSINFKVFGMECLRYPPAANQAMMRAGCRFLSLRTVSRRSVTQGPKPSQEGRPAKNDQEASPLKVGKKACSGADFFLAKRLELAVSTKEKPAQPAAAENDTKHGTADDEEEEKGEGDTPGFDDAPGEGFDDETLHQLRETSKLDERVQNLFSGNVFFLSREVPRMVLAAMVLACGAAAVGWQGDYSPFSEDDECITHHILDRPLPSALSSHAARREFVQPQWVFDSINAAAPLSVAPYRPGVPPPPHTSPFGASGSTSQGSSRVALSTSVPPAAHNDDDVESISSEAAEDLDIIEQKERELQEEQLAAQKEPSRHGGQEAISELKQRRMAIKQEEERERRKALLSKKHRRLLDKIEYGKKKQSRVLERLEAKRQKTK